MSLQVLQALHQLLGPVQQARGLQTPAEAPTQGASVRAQATRPPQRVGGIGQVQPVRQGWTGMLQNAPIQSGVPQYNLSSLVDAYNQSHYVPQNLRQAQLPAYHDLSRLQQPSNPLEDVKALPRGIVNAPISWLNMLVHPSRIL